MNNSFKAAAFGLFLCASPAMADQPAEQAESNDNIRGILFGGLTHGGDRIGGLEYEDGSTNNLDAGAFAYVGAGLEYDANDKFIVKLNGQYHWDMAAAKNGDMTFSRIVLEAIPYYRLNDNFRLGLGLGLHTNVELSGDFTGDIEYGNATAVIGSLGYQFDNSDSWIELRFVSVDYEIEKVGGLSLSDYNLTAPKTDGNHIGLAYHWAF